MTPSEENNPQLESIVTPPAQPQFIQMTPSGGALSQPIMTQLLPVHVPVSSTQTGQTIYQTVQMPVQITAPAQFVPQLIQNSSGHQQIMMHQVIGAPQFQQHQFTQILTPHGIQQVPVAPASVTPMPQTGAAASFPISCNMIPVPMAANQIVTSVGIVSSKPASSSEVTMTTASNINLDITTSTTLAGSPLVTANKPTAQKLKVTEDNRIKAEETQLQGNIVA